MPTQGKASTRATSWVVGYQKTTKPLKSETTIVRTFEINSATATQILSQNQNENYHSSDTLAHCIYGNSSGKTGSPIHPLRAIEYGAHEPKMLVSCLRQGN